MSKMAPGQASYAHPQPCSRRVILPCDSQTAASQRNPYINTAVGRRSIYMPNRQPTAETGYPYPINMPNYSTLPTPALFDLLTQPVIEQEQQYRSSTLSTPLQEPQALLKRPHSSCGTFEGLSDEDKHDEIQEHVQVSIASDRKPRKQQKRRSVGSNEPDDDYCDDEQMSDSHSPIPVRRPRRSARARKSSVPMDFLTPESDDTLSPRKEQKPPKSATTKKAKQARPGRLIRKKPIGVAVPKTLADAGPADRMMWEWKNQGKNWEEIRAEWKKMTGVEPGGSSLSVRYIKLVENLARNGAAGDIELLRFKKEAEEELMSQLWPKVAEKMLAYNTESEHNPKDLQKRYNMIVRSGYDVEKLLAEDKLQRESDHKQQSVIAGHGQYESDMVVNPRIGVDYENPTANATAASIRFQHGMDMQGFKSRNRNRGALPETSVDSDDLFGPIDILQARADGLNAESHLQDMKFEVPAQQKTENLVPGSAVSPRNPLTTYSNLQRYVEEPPLHISSTLVGYSSDSE